MKSVTRMPGKVVATVASVAIASAFGLTACSADHGNKQTDQSSQDQTKVEQKDERGHEISGTQAQDASSTSSSTSTDSQDTTHESEGVKIENAVDAESFKLHLDAIEDRVNSAVKSVENSEIPTDLDDRIGTFLEMVSPLDKLAADLEDVEGQLEVFYNKGAISADEFWKLKHRTDKLIEKLDKAEDNLELRVNSDK